MEKIENDRIAKRVYVGEYAVSRSVGRLWKRWIDIVKECSKKTGLDVRQPKRISHDRTVWRGFAWGIAQGKIALP